MSSPLRTPQSSSFPPPPQPNLTPKSNNFATNSSPKSVLFPYNRNQIIQTTFKPSPSPTKSTNSPTPSSPIPPSREERSPMLPSPEVPFQAPPSRALHSPSRRVHSLAISRCQVQEPPPSQATPPLTPMSSISTPSTTG